MRFTKMNGAGNDFIILNNLEERIPHDRFPDIARTLCHRRLSIGADGLMVIESPLQGGDYRMLFYNSDGSLGEMCGNGARCICRYGYEAGLTGETQRVESPSGLVTGTRIDQRNYRIRLTDPTVIDLDRPVDALGRTWPLEESRCFFGPEPGILPSTGRKSSMWRAEGERWTSTPRESAFRSMPP